MIHRRVWFPVSMVMLSSLSGCSEVLLSSAPSAPFFIPTPEDTRRLAALTHELDTMALACLEASACEQVHFARALVSLFENREAACASFRRAIADNPSSPLASSSALWLQLLENEKPAADDRSPLTEITAQFVRDWLERQLAEHTTYGKPSALTNAQDSTVEQSGAVQVLQKQVRDRDRRIAILRSQLDALKLIDQDHEERKRALKMPATLAPMTGTRPQ
jgi:hypothetical protein